MGAREYSPQQREWLQQDPAGFAAGDSNLYTYVNNEPTDSTDPSGLEVHVTDVDIKTAGPSGFPAFKHNLGPYSGPDSIGFAFKVHIDAVVTGKDDINQLTFRQDIFQLWFIEQTNGTSICFLNDAGGSRRVSRADADAAYEAFNNDTFTMGKDADTKRLFEDTRFRNQGMKEKWHWVEYLDVTGFSDQAPLTTKGNKYAYQYLGIRVSAKGTDGKEIVKTFWHYQGADVDNGQWSLMYWQTNGGPGL